jgi:hypothetical protein
MNMHQPIHLQTWANDGSKLPTWLNDKVIEGRCANGTMMIPTPLGQARVHVNDIVIRHGDDLWSRTPGEVHQFISGLKAKASLGVTAIGVGKVAQFGIKSRAKRGDKTSRQHSYPPPIGSMPSIEWVHVSSLSVDPTYQRSIDNVASQRLISTIASKFDWRLCAPLVVSRRSDESKVIIDGQHRWAAAIRRGDLLQLPCCIFTYDNPEDEARMFIVANRARKQMSRLDDFHAAVVAGDEDTLEILRLVQEAGLNVTRHLSAKRWQPGEVAFTSSIATKLRQHGPAIVSGALTNIAEAFEGEILTYGTSIFLALVKVLAEPLANLDPDRLVPMLQSRSMSDWGSLIRGVVGNDGRTAIIYEQFIHELGLLPANAFAA